MCKSASLTAKSIGLFRINKEESNIRSRQSCKVYISPHYFPHWPINNQEEEERTRHVRGAQDNLAGHCANCRMSC